MPEQPADLHLNLLKIVTLLVLFPLLYVLACRSLPAPRRGIGHDPNGKEDRADPHRTQEEPERPVPLSITTMPDYRFSDIPSRPENVRGNLGRSPARNWQHIVIHHSATETGGMDSFDRVARRERGWKGVGYHFVIGNGHGAGDGEVEVTFRWEDQIHGAHAGVEQYNEYGIGICLVGDFNTGYPTEQQIRALVSLITYLQERNNIPTSEILLHRHLKNTACPGEKFSDPFIKVLSLLRR